MTDFELKGIENRKKRAVDVWMKFRALYDAGLPIDEILNRVKKKNGGKYSRQYIYSAFKKLERYLKEEGARV